jgi:hypothetical protein
MLRYRRLRKSAYTFYASFYKEVLCITYFSTPLPSTQKPSFDGYLFPLKAKNNAPNSSKSKKAAQEGKFGTKKIGALEKI